MSYGCHSTLLDNEYLSDVPYCDWIVYFAASVTYYVHIAWQPVPQHLIPFPTSRNTVIYNYSNAVWLLFPSPLSILCIVCDKGVGSLFMAISKNHGLLI